MPIVRRRLRLPTSKEFFTALLSGSEGGLATTTAIIAGLLISTDRLDLVVLTATISFSVQAFNGSVGRFSSDRTANEIDHPRGWRSYEKPIKAALAHFFSHVFMSILVLLPIILIADIATALALCILLTLLILFLIGTYKGRLVENSPLHDGLEMVILGSLVISVGIISGVILSS